MKFHQMLIAAAVFLTACSSPKYVYHFDQYDYNAGRKTQTPVTLEAEESPVLLPDDALVATTKSQPVLKNETKPMVLPAPNTSVTEKVKAMSKTERKAFKKELKKDLKSLLKKDTKKGDSVDSEKRSKVFDTLVALSLVFGVAGMVLITLANISNAFWIVGAISLAIGAFLFVKWVANGNG